MKFFVLAALAVATAMPAQTPVRDLRNPAQPPAGTGVIRGMVVADATGSAVRLAHVVVIGALTGTLRVTMTDPEGRFAVSGLPADRYTVAASKPPYLGAIAGARRPARPGTAVVLAAGQAVDAVSIRLPMGAAIAGTITDERGGPGANIGVMLQQWRTEAGTRTLVPARVATVNTDERGRYRFYGLPPGEYVVTATNFDFRGGRQLSAADVDAALKGTAVPQGPVPPAQASSTFFPGTPRAEDATGIVVNAGDDRQGLDFRLELARPGRITGVVMTSDGAPAAGASVAFTTPTGSALGRSVTSGVGADGVFATPGMPPGSYVVVARGSGPTAGQFATAMVEVAGEDLARLTLTLRPALTLNGRLVFEGATPPALAGRRLPVQALTPNVGNLAPSVTDASGVFTIPNVMPGRYLIGGPLYFGASADSVTWTLKSVVADGRDITDLALEIADRAPKEIVVTYGDRWQELSGRLTTAAGAPVPDFTVIAFPANRDYWLQGSRRIVTTRPGTNGEFVLSGPGLTTLPPGDYLIATVTDIERSEHFDPAFLATLVSSAVPVTLAPGGKTVQNLMIR